MCAVINSKKKPNWAIELFEEIKCLLSKVRPYFLLLCTEVCFWLKRFIAIFYVGPAWEIAILWFDRFQNYVAVYASSRWEKWARNWQLNMRSLSSFCVKLKARKLMEVFFVCDLSRHWETWLWIFETFLKKGAEMILCESTVSIRRIIFPTIWFASNSYIVNSNQNP